MPELEYITNAKCGFSIKIGGKLAYMGMGIDSLFPLLWYQYDPLQ